MQRKHESPGNGVQRHAFTNRNRRGQEVFTKNPRVEEKNAGNFNGLAQRWKGIARQIARNRQRRHSRLEARQDKTRRRSRYTYESFLPILLYELSLSILYSRYFCPPLVQKKCPCLMPCSDSQGGSLAGGSARSSPIDRSCIPATQATTRTVPRAGPFGHGFTRTRVRPDDASKRPRFQQ